MAEFESRRAFEHIDKLAYEIGPRLAGTRGDRMASDYIFKQFEGIGLNVKIQEFKFVDRHLRSKATVALFTAALALSLLLPSIFSLIVWLAALALWRSLGRLLPKLTSRNLIATKEVEAAKRRVAVSAHYDSARCSTGIRLRLFAKFAFLPALALVTAVLVVRALAEPPAWPFVWIVLAAILFPVLAAMFAAASNRHASPGAEDNASGVAVMLETARALFDTPPPETSLTFIAFGAEEQGLVGSAALAEEKLLPPDTPVLNLDMVGASPAAYVIEGNGLFKKVRTPASLNQKIMESAGKAGLRPKLWWAALAGHDHVPLVKAGIKATTFTFDTSGSDKLGRRLAKWFKLPNARVRGYRQLHSLDDTPERIGLANIERAAVVALDFVATI